MKHAFKSLVGAAVVASIVVAAGTASASDDTKCHATIAKNITKYQATLAKNLVGCHKARNGGKQPLSKNCNDAIEADLKGKRTAARDKAAASIAKACLDGASPNQDAVRALYAACPSPVAAPITNFAQLSTCLLNLSEHYIEVIGERAMGLPAALPSEAAEDCQNGVGKALSKYVKTVSSNRAKCHSADEKDADALVDYAACVTDDEKGKIGPAEDAVEAAYALCSSGAVQTELGMCTVDLQSGLRNATTLDTCAMDEVIRPIVNGLTSAAHELSGVYNAIADVTISAGNGEVKQGSATRLDSGWRGTAHQVDVIDQSLGAVNISGCDADGRNCDVTHNARKNNCRCSNDPTLECDEMNAQDNCGGGNTCYCMFGPPLAISASATPVCVVNRFAGEFTGGTVELGEYNVGTSTRAIVHTGISQTQPCPICENDATPNSGNNLGGTCNGGPRDGLPCDQNADHPDFGPSSFDCPPDTLGNISGSGLLLALQFESGTSSITAAIPAAATWCDGSLPCHCSVCTADAKVGCTVDADCAAVGGTCGANVPTNPQQNACTGGTCNAEVDGTGDCPADFIDYCDGFLNGFGNGVITCSTDLDCDANDCDGDGMATADECGDCLFSDFRKCFPSTVTASGTPGIFESTGVSVFCSGQTGNPGVDNAGGLPGPGRVKLDFDFTLWCPDGTTRYELPGGSNCP
jgi:hypothetical protein